MPALPTRAPNIIDLTSSSPLSPTSWWRSQKPETFSRKDIERIRLALLGSGLPGEPDWRRAVLGDASTAIRVAVGQLKTKPIGAPEIDLALSAVLCCALEGNAASAVVLSSALRRRSKIDWPCRELSLLWLVADF